MLLRRLLSFFSELQGGRKDRRKIKVDRKYGMCYHVSRKACPNMRHALNDLEKGRRGA